MNTIKCPNCGTENKNTNIRCEACGTELNHISQDNTITNTDILRRNISEKSIKNLNIVITVILAFMLFPFFLVGLIFSGVGTYLIISENIEARNYSQAEGTLVKYDNIHNDDNGNEVCTGIYEYDVNGVKYYGSPKKTSTRSSFKQTLTIRYNPDNPNEYVITSNWIGILRSGLITIAITVAIFTFSKLKFKMSIKKINSETDTNS